MQTIKIKIPKKGAKKAKDTESSVIKDILPEIEYYKFEELVEEIIEPEYQDFQSFYEDFTRKETIRPKKPQIKKKVERPAFAAYFSISNFGKPIDIDLSKVHKVDFTREEIEQQVQSAYNKGFEDGQQITQMAIAEEFKKFEERVKSIENVIESLNAEYAKHIRQLKDIIVPLSIKISEHILRKEVEVNPKVVETQVEKALELIDNEKIFELKLNPLDVETLREVGSKLLSDPRLEGVEIVPDPSVERGGCILETEAGKIDATISSQLKKLENKLNNLLLNITEENV